MLVLTSKQRVSQVHLCDDAAKAPDIDFPIVRQTKYNLRSPIVSALDVSIDSLSFETARSKIDDLDTRLVHFFQENILRFEIGMDNMIFVKKMNAIEHLKHKATHEIKWKSVVSVRFYELV